MIKDTLIFDKEINSLIDYVHTLPYGCNRYLWAKRLLEDLQISNGKYIPIISNKQLSIIKPIPVVRFGKVYPSIRHAASTIKINEDELRYDILTHNHKHQVYILK